MTAHCSDDGEVEILRDRFRVVATADRVRVELAGWAQELLIACSVDTPDGPDRRRSTRLQGAERSTVSERITWTEQSSRWAKRHAVDVHADHLVFSTVVTGHGHIDGIRFFDVVEDAGFAEHFALTKHFNDHGRTGPGDYAVGSPIGFRHVMCPEPNSYARQLGHPHEQAQVSAHTDLDHRGGNFVANPGLLALALGREVDGEWLALGLAVQPGRHEFSEFSYAGGETFGLHLSCWGVPRVDGECSPPAMVVTVGSSAQAALQRYVAVLRERGLVSCPTRDDADWWHRPILCGWGHQCYQADLFRIRSPAERPADNAAYTLCTQVNYRDIIHTMDVRDVPWGTVVVDARWFIAGGLKDVDEGRWPDLRGFVDAVHAQGRQVLLWWSPFAHDGVPDAECVRFVPTADTPPNRPGRLSKFGAPLPGRKLAVDITLPAVRARIRKQIRRALGAGPGCWDADGFKLDHVSAAPGIYGMDFPDGSGRLFGVEAAHAAMALIHDTAKDVRPAALIMGQSPNPYFADVQDMVRLGDVYSHRAESVLEEMRFRASMAAIADPSCLIDTDGWPMPSMAAWREYAGEQPSLGVPSLYYCTHLDTTGEAFTEADYALIRARWRAP